MPRTLNATLLAAMNLGSYNAVIRAWGVLEGTRTVELKVLSFKLHFDELLIEVIGYTTAAPEICLERGVSIAGTEYTIYSSIFNVKRYEYRLGVYKLECKIIYPGQSTFTMDADKTYAQVITSVSAGITPLYIGDPAWKGYKCLPAGRTILLQSYRSALPWLRQKYLIYATEYDPTHLLWFSISEALAQASSYDLTVTELDINSIHREYRRFLWRDENSTVHYSSASSYPIHNLGYLESTCSAPAFTSPTSPHNFLLGTKITVPANLKYLTGDTAMIGSLKIVLDVTEIFDRKHAPSWYMELESLEYFYNTEGGSLPGTIQSAAPYTPLNTSYFDNVLSSEDNNLQAAMETIDDHDHLAFLDDAPVDEIRGKAFALVTDGTFYVWNGTIWIAISGGTPLNYYLKLESNDYLLTQDGFKIILESE